MAAGHRAEFVPFQIITRRAVEVMMGARCKHIRDVCQDECSLLTKVRDNSLDGPPNYGIICI